MGKHRKSPGQLLAQCADPTGREVQVVEIQDEFVTFKDGRTGEYVRAQYKPREWVHIRQVTDQSETEE